MPRQSKKEKLGILKDQVRVANKKLENDRGEKWLNRIENWEGNYFEDEPEHDHQFSVNTVRGLTSIIVPAVYFRNPKILCHPRRRGDERRAKITEKIINYWFDEIDLKTQAKRCVKDAWMFGVGYMKLGYNPQLDVLLEPIRDQVGNPLSTNEQEPLLTDKHGNVFVQKGGKFVQIMDKDGEIPPVGQEVILPNEYMRRGQPYAIRWAPWDVLIDPEAQYPDASDAQWVAFRAVLPLEMVKNDLMYKNTSDLVATKYSPSLIDDGDFFEKHRPIDEELERVEVWEIWQREWNNDLKRLDMYQYVITMEHDSFLMERKSPYLAEGFPLSVLVFEEDPKAPYGISPMDAVDPQMNTINLVRSRLATYRDKYQNKYILNTLSGLNKDDAEKLIHGRDEIVTVATELELKNVMVPLEFPDINPVLFDDYRLAWEEIQRILGVSEYQLTTGGVARQATEASYIQGSFNIRLNEKQDIVGDFVKKIAKYIKQLLFQYADYEMALKITGDAGQDEWALITVAHEIPEDLDIEVDVYPSMAQSKEVQLQNAMGMYNLLRMDPLINPQRLIENVLKAFGEPTPEAFILQPQTVIDPVTGQPVQVPPGQHGGAAAGGAIDQNDLRKQLTPSGSGPGDSGRQLSGEG